MKEQKLGIKTTKNLLAFSAGIDSTALFFMMIEENIPFDIAIVDYNQRAQSKDEIIYATQLAHKYEKKCFISTYPSNMKFTEKDARDYRYNFFDNILSENKYEALLTAHQLNDKLEWFLMQFTKGAGLTELVGMQEITYKNNYQIIKPLLSVSKQKLKEYLDNLNLKYFIDESNYDEKYKRNYFRHNFSDQLLDKYEDGILNSLNYLDEDNISLLNNTYEEKIEELTLFKFNGDLNVGLRLIDKELKKRGIIISNATREEIKEKKELVISHKIAISIFENKIYVTPVVNLKMDKKFKEKCRLNHIPKNIRPYIFKLYENNLFTF